VDTNTQTTDANQVYDYNVIDSNGNNIGSVDNVWVDDATGKLEFVGVKTGWLFGHTHIIPVENAQIDNQNQSLTVPYGQDQIKNAPSFPADATLSASDEDQVYSYYGMDRSTQTSPTGYAGGTQTEQTITTSSNTTGMGQDNLPTSPTDVDVTTAEEQLQVGKRTVQTGDVRLRKVALAKTDRVKLARRAAQAARS